MTGEFRGRYPCAMSVWLTREQQEELDRLSQEFRVSRAQLLRDAIDLGFKPMVKRLREDRGGCGGAGPGGGPVNEAD